MKVYKTVHRCTKCACTAIFAKDEEGKPIEIVQAGTTIYSMPIKDKKDYLYKRRQVC